ncbi:hypothetical protein B0H17DRAFT_1214460 [Mycena rosella]|uniref:Uncharacterized protein n=1 Tax=Mycena rosella TaxID=1033263 RepID=A0AAD7CQC9_MYCRO|nr:hypothetical protein B0H17DRAFT_1214460 [Mycena rosella]
MYAPSNSHVVDLYTVGIEERRPKRASVPFICGIEVEGPRGERVRIRALEDDSAMVNAMCTTLYEMVRHHIGELQQSGKTLRMANGVLVPSIGFWEGYIRFGGARVRACFEVFPSGGSWSFLFGKPLLEGFGAVHDYAVDSITVPGEKGPTVVSNQIGQMSLWDEARGNMHAVFLDPKSRAMSAGGSSAPPVRRVQIPDDRNPKNVNQHICEVEEVTHKKEDDHAESKEAQRNLTGDLPFPSREVQSDKERGSEDDTDKISFTEPSPTDEDKMNEWKGETLAHTGDVNSEDMRVYVPGDFSRSPLRDVPKTNHTSRAASGTDKFSRSAPALEVTQALKMTGLIVIWGMLMLAAQYGGASGKTSARGTLSGDPEFPPREVPAPNGSLERILVTDTTSPVTYLQKDWQRWRRRQRYTKRENRRRMKLRWRQKERKPETRAEEEPSEDDGEDARWCHWTPPCTLQFDVQIHGKVVRPRRPARVHSVGEGVQSPTRGVHNLPQTPSDEPADTNAPETAYLVQEMAEHLIRAAEESRVWENLRTGSPAAFGAYLVQVTADANAGAAPMKDGEQEHEEGFEQPEIRVGEDTSVFTRLTDPHNSKRVAAVLEAVTIGPDLTIEQRSTVENFISEFADCYALSMKEVIPIPGAEHTMNIPANTTFNTKVHQRPTAPAQKEWYNGVINEMLSAGIITGIDVKDVKCVSPTTLAQKAHQNGKTRTILELQHQINDQCIAVGIPPSFELPARPATPPEVEDPKKPSWRVCHDYRELNGKTKVAAMPQGDIQRKQGLLSGHRWVTVFDFAKGFYACATAEDIRPYLCFYVEG